MPERYRSGPRGIGGVSGMTLLAVIGAALLYGDGVITPAITVLSADEGLAVASPALEPGVVPITCLILVGLFAIQKQGTGRVGGLFGPVMLVWFLTLAGLGLWQILQRPDVLWAILSGHGVEFFQRHGLHGLLILGLVVLVVTGGEALYADMGHFGLVPIRRAWLGLVLPALVIAYLGQGALVLRDPTAAANPFYALVPAGPATYALVVLASLAAAYGLAVSGTMVVTTILYYLVIRHTWGWGRLPSLAVLLLFLSFDIPFLIANLFKFFDGGYIPMLIGAGLIAAMLVWSRGRTAVIQRYSTQFGPFETEWARLAPRVAARVPGTGIFLAADRGGGAAPDRP